MFYKIIHEPTKRIIAEKTKKAENVLGRMVGLMFKNKMDEYDGLLLSPCNSIQTFFMRFPLDVIFLDKRNRIVKIYRNIPPWRVTPIIWKARKTLELEAGKLEGDINIGDEVNIVCLN